VAVLCSDLVTRKPFLKAMSARVKVPGVLSRRWRLSQEVKCFLGELYNSHVCRSQRAVYRRKTKEDIVVASCRCLLISLSPTE